MSLLTTSVFTDCLPPLKKALAPTNATNKPTIDRFQHNHHRHCTHFTHAPAAKNANTRGNSDSSLPEVNPDSRPNASAVTRTPAGKHYVFSRSHSDVICTSTCTDVQVAHGRSDVDISVTPATVPEMGTMAWLSELINATLRAVLPRRCAEPTGPFALIADMVLSLFVSAGATRTTINRLPLYVVRHLDESGSIKDGSSRDQDSDNDNDNDTDVDLNANSVSLPLPLPLTLPNPTTTATPEKCPICLAPYEDGDHVRQLPMCRHVFHTECVDAWLQKKSLCPVCKTDPC